MHLSHNPCIVHSHSKMLRNSQISKSSTSTLSCLLVPVVAMTKGTYSFLSTLFLSISPSSPFMISTPHEPFVIFVLCKSNTLICLIIMIQLFTFSETFIYEMHLWNKITAYGSIYLFVILSNFAFVVSFTLIHNSFKLIISPFKLILCKLWHCNTKLPVFYHLFPLICP